MGRFCGGGWWWAGLRRALRQVGGGFGGVVGEDGGGFGAEAVLEFWGAMAGVHRFEVNEQCVVAPLAYEQESEHFSFGEQHPGIL